jgi:hypothetical protein
MVVILLFLVLSVTFCAFIFRWRTEKRRQGFAPLHDLYTGEDPSEFEIELEHRAQDGEYKDNPGAPLNEAGDEDDEKALHEIQLDPNQVDQAEVI